MHGRASTAYSHAEICLAPTAPHVASPVQLHPSMRGDHARCVASLSHAIAIGGMPLLWRGDILLVAARSEHHVPELYARQ
eukprot:6483972-Prymnesium_polylepis.1